MSEVTRFEPFLSREVRAGSRSSLAKGTYRLIHESIEAGDYEDAARLLDITILEAEELHEIYAEWPEQVLAWLRERVSADRLDEHLARLRSLIGSESIEGFEFGWSRYTTLTEEAIDACRARSIEALAVSERARALWQRTHDGAVDYLYGLLDIAVRESGEECLEEIWNDLMADWYVAHEKRLDIRAQPWSESARQLEVAIFDGFHAHLTGPDRMGDLEVIEESHRVGFRFSPCGSGGRAISESANPDGSRAGRPFDFAVTTTKHDWAWNKEGVCAYCVHCCLLNELQPIDRLGYPTRVIDPPVWPGDGGDPVCTWWVYGDPTDVPDSVFERVGRQREKKTKGAP